MTKHETFKRRVRTRMAKTEERYSAARKVLLDEAARRAATGGRAWVSQPEMSEDAVRSATGSGWDDWIDHVEALGLDEDQLNDHTTVAARLHSQGRLSMWWSQGITVGFERITGRRLPHQRADGTFTAGKSKTVSVEAAVLRELLLDDRHRTELFPGENTALVSRPSSKAIRVAIGPGVATFGLEDRGDGVTKVTVAHDKLPTYDDVEKWKFFWGEWLDATECDG